MYECPECYSKQNRITPLLNPRECLENHTQYICDTCGRCICIQADEKRKLQRWNFPFKSVEIAKLYLRTADVTKQKTCGIFEVISQTGRKSYKIFESKTDFQLYLKKNQKAVSQLKPVYQANLFKIFSNTQIRKLTPEEIEKYLIEQKK